MKHFRRTTKRGNRVRIQWDLSRLKRTSNSISTISQQDLIMALTNSQLIQTQTSSNNTHNNQRSLRYSLLKVTTSLISTSVTRRPLLARPNRINSNSKISRQTFSTSSELHHKTNLSHRSKRSNLRMLLISSMTSTLACPHNQQQYSNNQNLSYLQDFLVSINLLPIISSKPNSNRTYLELHSSLARLRLSSQSSKSSSSLRNQSLFLISQVSIPAKQTLCTQVSKI